MYSVTLLKPILKSVDWMGINWSALVLYRSNIQMRPVALVASNSVHEFFRQPIFLRLLFIVWHFRPEIDAAHSIMGGEIYLCFDTKSDQTDVCRKSSGPLETFSQPFNSNHKHLNIQLVSSESKFSKSFFQRPNPDYWLNPLVIPYNFVCSFHRKVKFMNHFSSDGSGRW